MIEQVLSKSNLRRLLFIIPMTGNCPSLFDSFGLKTGSHAGDIFFNITAPRSPIIGQVS
jgi:hypothetical protein